MVGGGLVVMAVLVFVIKLGMFMSESLPAVSN